MCRCTPEIKTPFCGKPGCEAPAQQKPATARPFYADETDIPDPLARLLHNAAVADFDDLRPLVLSVPDAPPHHRGKLDEVERLSHDCVLAEHTLQAVNNPVVAGRQRASGLRFADARTRPLLEALILFCTFASSAAGGNPPSFAQFLADRAAKRVGGATRGLRNDEMDRSGWILLGGCWQIKACNAGKNRGETLPPTHFSLPGPTPAPLGACALEARRWV